MKTYQQILNLAIGGIDRMGITAHMVEGAQWVALIALLYALYENYLRLDAGGLAKAAFRYLCVGIVLTHYKEAFPSVNSMFNAFADYISAQTGIADFYKLWSTDLSNRWNTVGNQNLLALITGQSAGFFDGLLLALGYIIYPVAYAIFCLLYGMYGAILYTVAPVILALFPATGPGVIARKYIENIAIWNMWSILYSVFGALMTAVQLGTVKAVADADSFFGIFNGLGQDVLLGIMSILLSLSILVIPFIASRLVRGDVGASIGATVRAAGMAVNQVASATKLAVEGLAAGAAAGS